MLASAAASAVMTAASIALDVALSPITLTIAAIGVAAYLLITHWNTLKAATVAVWDFIKAHIGTIAPAIALLITGPIGAAVVYVITHWHQVRSETVAVWNAIKQAATTTWDAIKTAVMAPINAAASAVRAAVNGMHTAAVSAWNALKSAAQSVFGSIDNIARSGINAALSVVRGFVNDFRSAGQALGNAVADGIRAVIGAVRSAAQAIWNTAKSIIEAPLHIHIDIPHISIPHPHFAEGGVTPGGLALVGERGPEVAAFPRGTRVVSHADVMNALGQGGGPAMAAAGPGGLTVNVYSSSFHPGDPKVLRDIGDATVAALGYQPGPGRPYRRIGP
jgi:hypothetical protein